MCCSKTSVKCSKSLKDTACRAKEHFLAKNRDWWVIILSFRQMKRTLSHVVLQNGRPEKPFEECCPRARRYKVNSLCENSSEEVIVKAAEKIFDKSSETVKFTLEKALALMLDAELSKHQFIRNAVRDIGCDIFANYTKVQGAKKECYPLDVDVTESYACVDLQNLLDHTVTRIFKTKTHEKLADIKEEVTFISKWVCYGSSGYSEYKQAFAEESVTNDNMFFTSSQLCA